MFRCRVSCPCALSVGEPHEPVSTSLMYGPRADGVRFDRNVTGRAVWFGRQGEELCEEKEAICHHLQRRHGGGKLLSPGTGQQGTRSSVRPRLWPRTRSFGRLLCCPGWNSAPLLPPAHSKTSHTEVQGWKKKNKNNNIFLYVRYFVHP